MSMRYVITGAPGSGKTPLLAELVARGHTGVPEAARAVLAEQRATNGEGVPERVPVRFNELMLERAIRDYNANDNAFFDRGIVDLVAYAEIFDLDPSDARRAAEEHRYDDPVFVLPSWPEIYTTDEERKMTYEMAKLFGDRIRDIYVELGYGLVDVPRDTIAIRTDLILRAIGTASGPGATIDA